MTKVKFSALVSDMRNKLNGSVLSKNRAGNYIRNKTTPVNPQTAFQQAIRQQLGSLSQQWRGLTQSQRQGWINSAPNFPYYDIFGDRRELDGKSLFVKLNMNLLNAGQAVINDAPLPGSVPEIAFTTGVAQVGGAVSVTINQATIPAGFAVQVHVTPPIPASINFVKNRYRLLTSSTSATAGVITLTADYEGRFGELVAGNVGERVHYKLQVVNLETGQLGVPVTGIVDVASA